MLKTYLEQTRRALWREGVWGNHARQIVEELQDHYESRARRLREAGSSEQEAGREALRLLGTPSAIASSARDVLQASAPARHPWLLAGLGMFITVSTVLLALFLVFWNVAVGGDDWLPHAAQFPFYMGAYVLVNWLPWLCGVGLLAWMCRRYPVGWKSLFIACAALGLASTGLQLAMYIEYTGGGHDHGDMTLALRIPIWNRPAMWLIDHFWMPGSYRAMLPCVIPAWNPQFLVKLIGPLFVCWAYRRFCLANVVAVRGETLA